MAAILEALTPSHSLCVFPPPPPLGPEPSTSHPQFSSPGKIAQFSVVLWIVLSLFLVFGGSVVVFYVQVSLGHSNP